MPLDIVRANISNIFATKELIKILSSRSDQLVIETLYTGYPLSANIDGNITVDALLVSERFGLVAFIFESADNSHDIIENQGELFFQLTNTLTQYSGLRKGRTLAFEPYVISIVPESLLAQNTENGYVISTFETLSNTLENLPVFDTDYFHVLVESLQKIASIKPRKKRDNVKISGSKGDIIKKIEKEIANLDQWQKKAALEMVDGPQRIRGLAGSGKTIVLALKAAYLHAQYPEWEIVVTYYTRSLWQQYRDLITKFAFEFSKDEPNWDKIHLYHAWGSSSEQGLYSEIARSVNALPMNFTNARLKFGREKAFTGICEELDSIIPDNYIPQYDIVLIDEAQDMPAAFFRLVYKSVQKEKRIVWAYDELQNLNSATMPSIVEMFGVSNDGRALVNLINEADQPMQDIILPVCYRNPPWALSLAHSLGFGIYRKPLVQHFENINLWEEIGYKINKGNLKHGKEVTLSRKADSTPKYFYDLLSPEDVIITKNFDDVDVQYDWIARQIKKNIVEDELDPDDILVIFPSVISAKSQYQKFTQHLARYSISSMMAGVTNDRDIFRIAGSVSCSAIYRAKGNEAPIVYIANSEYCYEGVELIKLRNTLFTAITRSRAWVRICGVGTQMKELTAEIERFRSKDYTLSFKVPTITEMNKLRIINRERSESENRKIEEAQKGMKTFIDLINKGEIDATQIPEFSALMKLYLSNNHNGEDSEENE
ncbi:MAG: RNA helicase [Firmicutes bacterium HGW-Firmicutes-9]|jgi:superfamily I DNA and RNA helicase|nr:MAG: RNA helicase [Firmicutes bacterium HGW-Firmicutes-9]